MDGFAFLCTEKIFNTHPKFKQDFNKELSSLHQYKYRTLNKIYKRKLQNIKSIPCFVGNPENTQTSWRPCWHTNEEHCETLSWSGNLLSNVDVSAPCWRWPAVSPAGRVSGRRPRRRPAPPLPSGRSCRQQVARTPCWRTSPDESTCTPTWAQSRSRRHGEAASDEKHVQRKHVWTGFTLDGDSFSRRSEKVHVRSTDGYVQI